MPLSSSLLVVPLSSLIALLTLLSLSVNVQYKDPVTKKIGLGACSAVYVSPTEALTAAHCVKTTTGKVWVRNSSNQAFSAHIVKQDKRMDLCLLRIDGPKHKYVKLGKPVRVNDPIYTMGNDDRMPFTFGKGYVKNVLIDNETHVLTIVHSASILGGASGGGVFDRKGRLVGINTMTYQGITYATDLEIIRGFLGKRR